MMISAASKLYSSINRKFLGKRKCHKKTKLAVYKCVYAPTLTYSCESWTLNNKSKKLIQTMEMRVLRRIEKKSRRDRVRNVNIRKKLNIFSLYDKIKCFQLRWFGLVCRLNEERYPRQAKHGR